MDRPHVTILTVCLGNICRSPTAAAALVAAAADAGVAVAVDSAGTGNWHVGAPPDPRMCAAGEAVGLTLEGTAHQVTADDLDRYDLVLAMDARNLADVRRMARSDAVRQRIRLFRDFDPDGGGDVPDPYYGGPDGFDDVVAIVRRTARAVIAAIAEDGVTARRDAS